VRAGLGVEAERAEGTEILKFWDALAVESVKRVLRRWCLDRDHDVLLSLR
jgi:hypothetical protein